MKRLLAPKVLHPRPQRQAHASSPPGSARASQTATATTTATATSSNSATAVGPAGEALENAPLLALGDHAHDEERNLEHSFFAAGLSEDTLRAISERQREIVERELPASSAQRWVFRVALAAGLALAGGLGVRFAGANGESITRLLGGGVGAPTVASAPVAVVNPVAVAPEPPVSPAPEPVLAVAAAPVFFGPELPPAAAIADGTGTAIATAQPAAPRIVSVRDLRAKVEPGAAALPAAEIDGEAGQGEAAVEPVASSSGPQEPAAAVEAQERAAAAPMPDDPQEACGEQLRRGEFKVIKATCTVAFEAQPNAQLAVDVARAALDERRNREAALWARKAIAVDSGFADAFVFLGAAESELGHSDAARAAYGRYLELQPNGEQAASVRAIIEKL